MCFKCSLFQDVTTCRPDDSLSSEQDSNEEEEPQMGLAICGTAVLLIPHLPMWPKASISPLGKYSSAAVAADNGLCSEIGRDALLRGGNAVDAAIAALFCIGVMDTHSAGLGGGHFMTIYNSSTQKCTVIDAREVAPKAATETMYEGRWNESRTGGNQCSDEQVSPIGWRAVAVPGELHGLWTEFEKYGSGKISWKSLVQPTIDLLEEGFPTSHALAKALAGKAQYIAGESTMKDFINPKTGNVYRNGEQIKTRNSFLNTLRRLANTSNPIQEFYEGEMAREMASEFKRFGGILTEADFASYRSLVIPSSDVIYTSLKNDRVICGPPPPSGSAIAQAILNIMDGYKYDMKKFEDVSLLYHHFIESSKFAKSLCGRRNSDSAMLIRHALSDPRNSWGTHVETITEIMKMFDDGRLVAIEFAARRWLGDPAFVHNATDIARNITTKEWAEWVRHVEAKSLITNKTHPDEYYGGSLLAPPQDHGTTHISVVDSHGNAVSVTSTINMYFGAAVTSPSTGIVWNDEMDDFSLPGRPNFFGLPPSPANFIQPGKRPMSSQCPLIIFDTKSDKQTKPVVLAVGGAGGSTIITGVAGVAFHSLWLKENVKQAVDAPRLHNQLYPNVTRHEPNFPKEYLAELAARGHVLSKAKNLTVVMAVERDSSGEVYANSDFRKGEESAPAGY
ncbi:putative gamma-glutamyltransferase [Ancylostoma ceylanicum]|uniref:Putative gamma-glutamyltransferase n=1 Tax=Ancylostoma ceylanicum TaxID=53326 RepID=A0A0D6LQV8_9BILA|nr:putative gamma-glutamyltransferase [Ancylostoma ceylanicum]